MNQIHDIEGLDPISMWPLALGWWFLIVGAVCVIGYFLISWIIFKFSWKNYALKKLVTLEKNLTEVNASATLIQLSEYLRRIAVRRFSRKVCAGLTGNAWLKWLALHDPKQFDWEKQGRCLIDAPYAPEHASLPTAQVKELIHAARNWVG